MKRKVNIPNVIIILVLIIGMVFMVYPFLYMILSSFKFNKEIVRIPPTFFPEEFTWDNYSLVFEKFNFGVFFKNSMFLTILKTAIILYTSALFGYVFAKIEFRGREVIFMFLLATMMIPWPVTLAPTYQMMVWFKWTGTYWSLIIPSMLSTFGIFLLRQNMSTVPNDLIHAARIDGAGEFTCFHTIVLPNVTATLSALGIFQFLWVWDDYLWPFLMIQKKNMYTLPVGLSLFNGQYYSNHGGVLAGATISVVPVVIVYLIFQKRFIEGIAMTGMKG